MVFLEQYRANLNESHNAALAMRWLTENGNLYQGKWVALRGNVLLAEGDSAKAVYAQVSASENPPFIIKVDVVQQEPFAGW